MVPLAAGHEREAVVATMAERHLAEADRHIAESEACVTRQRLLVGRLAAGHHDTGKAKALLVALDGMLAHRAVILAEIEQERGEPPSP